MKASLLSSIIGCSLLSGLFGYFSYIRYWKYAEEIDQAQSGFLAPDGSNLTSGGIFWTAPALFWGLLAIGLMIVFAVTRKIPNQPVRPTSLRSAVDR